VNDAYDSALTVSGAGEPMVLVPGMDGTGRLFYAQVPHLARSYRVATYALRNEATGWSTLVADLGGIVDRVAPESQRAIIVGESFGGALALTYALAAPEKVSALVVLNSFAFFQPQLRLHLAYAGLRALPWGMMGLVRRATAFRLHSAHTHRDEIRRFMALTAGASRLGYLNRLRLLANYDVRDRLGELRMPALFLASDRDHLVPSLAQAELMSGRVSDSALHVLAGHGHICLIAPDLDLEQIVSSWLVSVRQRKCSVWS
jgi:pimeloyl-ACP methyl ester carboxylesterase